MTIEREFIDSRVRDLEIEEFLRKELKQSVFSHVEIKRTPLGTRLQVYALRPGIVIGTGGSNVRALTAEIKNRFELENPHIKVMQVEVPELDAQIMAEKIASFLERGYYFKKVAYRSLYHIMQSGARGVEIRISGTIPSKRSRTWKFKQGYNRYCGETAKEKIDIGRSKALLKQGVIGVVVRIVPPTVTFPDEIEVKKSMFKGEEKEGETKEVTPEEAEKLDKKAEEFEKGLEKEIEETQDDEEPEGVEVEEEKEEKKEEEKPKAKKTSTKESD